ncbi:hypothetical protein [Chroococcidiopsis cubana]|uniref:hypothetical protein n=1 Tax=Chroococcidiopsis cubana TaxID=171392 RepID=UPI000F8D0925|nr:hypothetical protein [Chroococcidiopsis cubana]
MTQPASTSKHKAVTDLLPRRRSRLKDVPPENAPLQNSKQPVTLWQLIDAISILHVIQDEPTQGKSLIKRPKF